MKVVIAPDAFKGSLSAKLVADAIAVGLLKADPSLEVIKIPMADGGEGTVEALTDATGGRIIRLAVKDPLMRVIDASYGILGDGVTAVIEMAKASGLPLLSEDERNPLITSSYGTGELMMDALHRGCTNIIIGLGGSATNDAGQGMLRALGVKFLDAENKEIPHGGAGLHRLTSLDVSNLDPRIANCSIVAACDVNNPLVGKMGATEIFARQKGATEAMVMTLEKSLQQFGQIVHEILHVDVNHLEGAGAAGGMGAAVMAFLGASLEKGIDIVLEKTGLERIVKDADLVITGEGFMDEQTLYGKAPMGVARVASRYDVPVIAIAGGLGEGIECLYDHGFSAFFAIVDKPMRLEEAIRHSEVLLTNLSERLMRTLMIDLWS